MRIIFREHKTERKKRSGHFVLVWFWSSKCTAEDGSLFKQCACKLVCVLKTWFKQTQKHTLHASNLQQSVCAASCLMPLLLLEISTRMRSRQAKKWNSGDHMQQAILNYRRSTVGRICTDEILLSTAMAGMTHSLHAWNMSAEYVRRRKRRKCFFLSLQLFVNFGTIMYDSRWPFRSSAPIVSFKSKCSFQSATKAENCNTTKRFMSF